MAILTVKFYRGIIKSREQVSYNGRDYIYEYLYDTNGRLKSKKDIRRNGSVTENEDEYNYTYDKFGRMTKCAKTINGKGYTDTYTYNAAGNRTYQSEYIVQENKYRQKQYFWTRGKLLGQYLEDGTITTYKYDYADRLVKRTTGNSTMEYYYDGDRLVAQSSSDGSSIYYFYDDAGVCGAEYNNEYYEFVRNIFGDIVVVLKGGEIAGRYEYDPYGVCTEYTQNNFVKLNPFRYRGYFYDTVSGMYVLKTRFYDPVTAQFLSPDHPDYLDPETLGGIDLYAYCLNNPVMYVDPTGTSLEWWQGLLIGIGIIVLTVPFVGAIAASAGAVGALAGTGAAALGLSASAVASVTSIATMSTYLIAGGVLLFGISDAVQYISGDWNPIRDIIMGGNQLAYDITSSIFYSLGTVATIAGAVGPKILKQVSAKWGTAKFLNGKIVGHEINFRSLSGAWNFRIDATIHGTPKYHHNPHVHYLKPSVGQGGLTMSVLYFWELLRYFF